MTHLKKYGIYYAIAAVIIIIIAMNWNTVKGWFSSASSVQQRISSSIGKKCVCGSPCCSCGAGQTYGENIC